MVVAFVFSAAVAMGAGKNAPDIETAIHRSVISLSQIVRDFLSKGIELKRISRIAVLLKECGVNTDTILYWKLAEKCIYMQREDGGWTDVVETIWSTALLNFFNEFSVPAKKAFEWLKEQESGNGGWGNSLRDTARIPITGLLLYLIPQLSTDKNLKWLENQLYQEQELEPCLTYKAAFTLLAFSRNDYHPAKKDFIAETINLLCNQQNIDGGWSPWKGHPVGSDPWCTGINTTALLQYYDKIPTEILWNAFKWLKEKQLPNGLWPYHYIEDGSSCAIYAMVGLYRKLSKYDVDQ